MERSRVDDEWVEGVLERSRPRLDMAAKTALAERALPARRAPRRNGRLVAGLVTASGLAALWLVAGLAGVEPFSDPDGAVQAGRDCRTVEVPRAVRSPIVLTGADGKERIATVTRVVMRREQRC
jgi:hypothetical protein